MNKHFAKLTSIALAVCLILPATSHGLDSKQVFAKLSPSTVLIQDLDGEGSGIILTESGLILTNYHVVAANLDLKIRAKVKFGTKFALTEIENIKLVKVHPQYDLALLEATPPPNGKFVPAEILPKTIPLETGSRCFAIGNPGGPGGEALDLTITEGIISSASRKMEGMDVIQFSAAINPGNSGGPVCDDMGRVFGIATWKLDQTEGIGFAIPTQKLVMSEFIDAKLRKADIGLMKEAAAAAQNYYALAMRTGGQDRDLLLQASAECYRIMMLADPNNPEPCNNLGVIFLNVGRKDMAKKYFEAARKMDPAYAPSCHLLGRLMCGERPDDKDLAEKCIQMWLVAIEAYETKEPMSAGHCAADIAEALTVTLKRPAAAAYMLRWSEAIRASQSFSDNDTKIQNQLWGMLQQQLPADQLAAVRSKVAGFSKAEFLEVQTGKALASTVNSVAAKAASGVKATDGIPPIDAAQLEAKARESAAKFVVQRVPVPASGLEVPLPDAPQGPILANGGCQIVMRFPELTKIGIFNIPAGKFDGFIDCLDSNALIAAGGQVLAVYLPSSRMFEFYDLATLEKRASGKSPFPGQVRFLGMGMNNPMRIFGLVDSVDKHKGPYYEPFLFHPADFSATGFESYDGDDHNRFARFLYMDDAGMEGAADEYGSMFAVRHTGRPTGGGVAYYGLPSSSQTVEHAYDDELSSTLQFSQNGAFILTKNSIKVPHTSQERGYRPQENLYSKVNPNSAYALLAPVAGYPAVVEHIDPTDNRAEFHGFRLRALPALNVIADIPVAEATASQLIVYGSKSMVVRPMGTKGGGVQSVRRVSDVDGHNTAFMFASAYCDRIAYLLTDEKKLFLFSLGLNGGSQDDDMARPGAHFERKLSLAAGTSVTLQSAPKGLKYEAATNKLIWEVPADVKTGQAVQVIMLIKGADGKQDYHIEKISVP